MYGNANTADRGGEEEEEEEDEEGLERGCIFPGQL